MCLLYKMTAKQNEPVTLYKLYRLGELLLLGMIPKDLQTDVEIIIFRAAFETISS